MTGNSALTHIVGDSFKYSINVFDRNGVALTPSKLTFTCAALGIEREFVWDEVANAYSVMFSAEETAQWKPRTTTYDVTACFNGTVVSQTGILLKILKKNNPVEEACSHG